MLKLITGRSCGQSYVFTRVCDSVHRGVSASVHVGIPPPHQGDPPNQRDPPAKETPSAKETPVPRRHPPANRLRHTVNERPVRILLECILVLKYTQGRN